MATMKHDPDVQAFLAQLATQAATTGHIVMTNDLAKAFDVAVWKLDQQKDPALYREYIADKHYRYGTGKRHASYNGKM